MCLLNVPYRVRRNFTGKMTAIAVHHFLMGGGLYGTRLAYRWSLATRRPS